MIRIFIFAFALLLTLSDVLGQVSQKIIVEHFTNTLCVLCSSRNPDFYEVYNNNPDILHVSYYPSSPFRNCQLHQHNTVESDGRTNYYNIYGSTPKFVIQGKNNTQYAKDDVYEPYQNKLSDVSISLVQYIDDAGQINAEIIIKNETGANLANTVLFVGVAETYLRVEGANVREKDNYDVFRKAFTPAEGESINLSETLSASYKIDIHPDWDLQQLYVYAIVQNADAKTVIQAEAAAPGIERMVGINNYQIETTAFYPNPASSFIYSSTNFNEIEIYNNKGQVVLNTNTNINNKIDVHQLKKGLYFIKALTTENSIIVQKFLKE